MRNKFLDTEKISFEKARVIIVPFGFESTTTYIKGTKNGPKAIIKASEQIEWFDEEIWQETPERVAIATWPAVKANIQYQAAKKQLQAKVNKIRGAKKLPIILGGEHSLTPMVIEALVEPYFKDFSLLQFDAHADLRDGYLGQKYSHASAMRRCLDFPKINLVQIGVRNISNEDDELKFWQKNQHRIKTFWAKDKKTWKIDEIVSSLKENVYLTFDVDVLDPSIMPSTGTPEPGGLNWYETLDILRAVAKNKKIIGADFLELAPIKNLHAPDFLAAKLIYKLIGYIFN